MPEANSSHNQTPHESERIQWVDALRGLGIVLVVFAHTEAPGSNWIYVFHMPLFFMISGVLSGRGARRGVLNFVRSRSVALGLPYLAFSLLGIFCLVVKQLLRGHGECSSLAMFHLRCMLFAERGYSPFHGVLWFLPCLLITELVHVVWRNYFGFSSTKLMLLCGAAFLVGFRREGLFTEDLPWSLDILPVSLFFYSFGAVLVHFSLLEQVQRHAWRLAVVGALVVSFSYCANQRVDLYHGYIGSAWIYLIGAMAGCLGSLAISRRLQSNEWLRWAGRNTMPIFGLHHWYGFTAANLFLGPLILKLPVSGLWALLCKGILVFSFTIALLGLALLGWGYLRRRYPFFSILSKILSGRRRAVG